MKKFTVLLCYPGYLQNQPGEAYIAHVSAADATHAIAHAQVEVAQANSHEADLEQDMVSYEPTDWIPVAVYLGHLEQPEW